MLSGYLVLITLILHLPFSTMTPESCGVDWEAQSIDKMLLAATAQAPDCVCDILYSEEVCCAVPNSMSCFEWQKNESCGDTMCDELLMDKAHQFPSCTPTASLMSCESGVT